MYRIMSLVLLSFLCTPGLVGAQTQASTRAKRVAILDFDYSTVRTSTAALFGTDIDVGRGVSDMLVTSLVNDGTYSVIERALLDQILAEQEFASSDRVDSSSAAQIGRVLSVDAIIVGSVTQFGNDTRSTALGGVGRAIGRLGFGGFGRDETKAIVAVDARIIDVDTAEILAVAQGTGESSRTSTTVLGGGGSWSGFGAGGVNFGSSDFQDDPRRSRASGNGKPQRRAGVAERPYHAATGRGGGSGGRRGRQSRHRERRKQCRGERWDRMTIERVTREIRDPATDAIIRRLNSEVGAIELIDVDAVSAIGRIVAGADFQVGDVVKTAGS